MEITVTEIKEEIKDWLDHTDAENTMLLYNEWFDNEITNFDPTTGLFTIIDADR